MPSISCQKLVENEIRAPRGMAVVHNRYVSAARRAFVVRIRGGRAAAGSHLRTSGTL